MKSRSIGLTVRLVLLLGALAMAYGCYLAMFTEVSYTAHYPHFQLSSENPGQWVKLRSGEYADSDRLAPLYVSLDGKVYFLPELTEAQVSEYSIPAELRSAEGADPGTGLRTPDESGKTAYFAGFNQFIFRHGKLVAIVFDGYGPRVGVQREGPFASPIMTREEAEALFGPADRVEKRRHKRSLVFR
jgi:hypothetical protein